MKCTCGSSNFVHLQQGNVLTDLIKCVGVNIHCTTPKPTLYDIKIMQSIMAYIECTQTRGLALGLF